MIERTFDAKVWKVNQSMVVTIPKSVVRKLKIKSGEEIETSIMK